MQTEELTIHDIDNLSPGTVLYCQTGKSEYIFLSDGTKHQDENKALCYSRAYMYRTNKDNYILCENRSHIKERLVFNNNCSVIRRANEDEIKIFFELYKFKLSEKILPEEIYLLPIKTYITCCGPYNNKKIYQVYGTINDNIIQTSGRIKIIFGDNVDTIEGVIAQRSIDFNYIKNVYYRLANQSEIDLYKKFISHTNPGTKTTFEVVKSSSESDLCIYNENNISSKLAFESKLKPFVTKVLVCDGEGDFWRPAIFGCIAPHGYRYGVVGGLQYKHCILYRENKNLIAKPFKDYKA